MGFKNPVRCDLCGKEVRSPKPGIVYHFCQYCWEKHGRNKKAIMKSLAKKVKDWQRCKCTGCGNEITIPSQHSIKQRRLICMVCHAITLHNFVELV